MQQSIGEESEGEDLFEGKGDVAAINSRRALCSRLILEYGGFGRFEAIRILKVTHL